MFKAVFRTLSRLPKKTSQTYIFRSIYYKVANQEKYFQQKHFVEIPLRIRCLESSDLPRSCRALFTNCRDSVIRQGVLLLVYFPFLKKTLDFKIVFRMLSVLLNKIGRILNVSFARDGCAKITKN